MDKGEGQMIPNHTAQRDPAFSFKLTKFPGNASVDWNSDIDWESDVDWESNIDWDFEQAHSCGHCREIVIDTHSLRPDLDSIQDDGGNVFHRCTDYQIKLGDAREAAAECDLFRWLTNIEAVDDLADENFVVWRHGVIADRTRVISLGVNDPTGLVLLDGLRPYQGEVLMIVTRHGMLPL